SSLSASPRRTDADPSSCWGWQRRSRLSTRPEPLTAPGTSPGPGPRPGGPCRPSSPTDTDATVLVLGGRRVRHADGTNAPPACGYRPPTGHRPRPPASPHRLRTGPGTGAARTPGSPPDRNSTCRKPPPPTPAASGPSTGPRTPPGAPA